MKLEIKQVKVVFVNERSYSPKPQSNLKWRYFKLTFADVDTLSTMKHRNLFN